jgi:hypothetical protein
MRTTKNVNKIHFKIITIIKTIIAIIITIIIIAIKRRVWRM